MIGSPQPVISWYRNDELLTEGGRVRVGTGEDGRHSLTILQTKPNDFGVYKCVARNKHGTVTCRARMLCGGKIIKYYQITVTKIILLYKCGLILHMYFDHVTGFVNALDIKLMYVLYIKEAEMN